MENLKLTDAQLILSLRACEDKDTCAGCHLGPPAGDCFNDLKRMARERIEALAEELRKLRDATESVCQREAEAMVKLAKEANLALERGLAGVSEAHFAKMQEHQAQLTELGREIIIHAEPHEEHGWRIDWVTVEGREIYRREGTADGRVSE